MANIVPLITPIKKALMAISEIHIMTILKWFYIIYIYNFYSKNFILNYILVNQIC